MNILDEIAQATRLRVAEDKKRIPLEAYKELLETGSSAQAAGAESLARENGGQRFLNALRTPGMSFICEVKKASPSKGVIAEHFPYLEIAREYEAAGASCISCLTETQWFKGSNEVFTDIRKTVDTPMIRKDFVVDEYQLYQAKAMGADAALLICAITDDEHLLRYVDICEQLGLASLVETHDEDELHRAIAANAKIIGVNNRNLKDFTVDFGNSIRLRWLVPPEIAFVTESGVKTPEDIKLLADNGVDAVLIGETLMHADDKRAMLDTLKGLL